MLGACSGFASKPFEAKTFFLAFVKLMQGHGRATHSQDIPEVVLPGTQESCRYAIISIDRDIQYQVGLVKNFVGESRKCAVITPHDRFDCAMLCHCRQLANIEDYIGITSIVSSQTLPTSLLAVINSFSFFLPVRFKSSIQAYSMCSIQNDQVPQPLLLRITSVLEDLHSTKDTFPSQIIEIKSSISCLSSPFSCSR